VIVRWNKNEEKMMPCEAEMIPLVRWNGRLMEWGGGS
jgi:hypothetical protein